MTRDASGFRHAPITCLKRHDKMAAVTSLKRAYGGPRGPKMAAEVKMAAPMRTRKPLTKCRKIKALWRSLAPLTFVTDSQLLSPMASRSLFSKAPDPPEAAGPNRASDSGRGGVRGVRRSAKRVAPDPEEVVPGQRVALLDGARSAW